MKKKFNFDHIHQIAEELPAVQDTAARYVNLEMKVFNIILNNSEVTEEMIDNVDIEGLRRAFDVVNYAPTYEEEYEEEHPREGLRESLFQHVYVREYIDELHNMPPVQPTIKFF